MMEEDSLSPEPCTVPTLGCLETQKPQGRALPVTHQLDGDH